MEKNLRKQFVLHLQQGIVIPGELIFPGSGADPYPVSQSLVALGVASSGSLELYTAGPGTHQSAGHLMKSLIIRFFPGHINLKCR